VLFEAPLVGCDDLVKAHNVLDLAGEYDLYELAGLANDLVGGLIPPLPGGVEHGEPVREAGCDLAIDETVPIGFVHAEAAADVAAEHQFGHLAGSLTPEAIQQLCVGAAGKRQDEHQARSHSKQHSHSARSSASSFAKADDPVNTKGLRWLLDARVRGHAAGRESQPLMRSMAAPHAASLSSSRSKPRSR
jgi:hypothetical protein